MSNSHQSEIPRTRVNIQLSLHTGGAQKKVELPLKLMVVGDYSNGPEQHPVSEREKVNINKNNFDSVLAEFSPSVNLSVVNTLAGDGSGESINLSFNEMKDFEPEQIARQIPQLKAMLAMRNLLRDLKANLLEMQPALARLSAALVQMESLAASAQQARALAADVSRQQKLLKQKIEQLQEEVILGSAPKGMALVSGEDMQLSASENLTLTAGKQLDVGVQKDFTLAAGKRLSLYSREGAKLFSSQNDIDIQAQGGNITTWSTQDTHISSGKKLVVTAQDELTLVCGGGYIKIKSGNVEIGGPGKLLIKNTGIKKAGSGSIQGVMKSFEPESFDEKFKLTHSLTQEPLANQRYRIKLPGGKLIEGVTSEAGETSLTQSQVTDDMEITWLERVIK